MKRLQLRELSEALRNAISSVMETDEILEPGKKKPTVRVDTPASTIAHARQMYGLETPTEIPPPPRVPTFKSTAPKLAPTAPVGKSAPIPKELLPPEPEASTVPGNPVKPKIRPTVRVDTPASTKTAAKKQYGIPDFEQWVKF